MNALSPVVVPQAPRVRLTVVEVKLEWHHFWPCLRYWTWYQELGPAYRNTVLVLGPVRVILRRFLEEEAE